MSREIVLLPDSERRFFFIPQTKASSEFVLGLLSQEVVALEVFNASDMQYISGICKPAVAAAIVSQNPDKIKGYIDSLKMLKTRMSEND
jgi:hypothetical protein